MWQRLALVSSKVRWSNSASNVSLERMAYGLLRAAQECLTGAE